MIKTFEELFEKLQTDGRRKSVPEAEWSQIQNADVTLQDVTDAGMAVFWMTGYLFCLSDEGYISDDEWDILHHLLMDEINE